MMITIAVSDEIVRQAQEHGGDVVSYVESLIDQGVKQGAIRAEQPPVLISAIERIRALRSSASVR